jgi:diguanylate cyclase (GGDEF)-like protein
MGWALTTGKRSRRTADLEAILNAEGLYPVLLDETRRGPPDVVLVELTPGEGPATVLELRKVVPAHVPAIVVSASRQVRDLVWAQRVALGVVAVHPVDTPTEAFLASLGMIRSFAPPVDPLQVELEATRARNQEARWALKHFEALVDHLDTGVILYDPQGTVCLANRMVCALLGMRAQELFRMDRVAIANMLGRLPPADGERAEFVLSTRVLRWVTRSVDLPEGSGRLDTLVDVTAEMELAEFQTRLALTDSLTGLYNRRGGEDALKREVARAARSGQPLAFVLMDIDHFKQVNDRHGHFAGDRVLAQVAALFGRQARASDVCVRWGGEELLAILPATSLAGARIFAERVRRAVEGSDFGVVGRVTVSAGVSEMGEDDAATAIARADAAMYAAKAAGRNCVR